MLLVFIIFFSKILAVYESSCIGYDINQNTCCFCSSGFYDENFLSKQFSNCSISLDLEINECKTKNSNEIIQRKVLLLVNLTNQTALSMFDQIYTSLIEALLSETWFLLQENVLIEKIYISKEIHYHYNSLEYAKNLEIFRRVDTKISITPLYCDEFDVIDYCLERTEKAIIKFKIMNFRIYVSNYISFTDIEIDGIDTLYIDRTNDCLTSNKQCCLVSELNGSDSIQNDNNCIISNMRIKYSINNIYSSFFVMEPIFDKENKNLPELIIERCNIYNLLIYDENIYTFASFIKIFSFGGKITINDLFLENTYFINGIIFNEKEIDNHDILYNFNNFSTYYELYMDEISNQTFLINIDNMTINQFNAYSFIDDNILNDMYLFSFSKWKGNININNLNIKNFYGSDTRDNWSFNFEQSEGNNTIENSFFNNLQNLSLIKSINSLLTIYGIEFGETQLVDPIFLIQNLEDNPLNFVVSDCFFYNLTFISESEENRLLNFSNSLTFFNQTIFYRIYGMSAIFMNSRFSAINLKFIHISFQIREIHLINTTTYLNQSNFHDLVAINHIFIIENSDIFVNFQTNFTEVSVRSVYLCSNLNYFTLLNGYFIKFINLEWFWSTDSKFFNILFSGMNLTNFSYSMGFLTIMNKVIMRYENSSFQYFQALASAQAFLRGFSGEFYINNCLFYQILGGNQSYGIIIIQSMKNMFNNSKFLNMGWNSPYISTMNNKNISDNVHMFWLWKSKGIIIDNCEFHNDGPFSLFTGFLYFTIVMNPIIVKDSKFIVTNKVQNFYYMGIIVTESNNVTFNGNYIEGLRCSSEQFFDHSNGPLGFFVTPAYARMKNTKVFIGNNNSFVNCSCKSGGSFALINFNNVILQNFSFQNSFAKIGGSFLIVSSSFVQCTNIVILNSFADKSGLFLVKNIDILIMSECIFNRSQTKIDSSISIINILTFVLQNSIIKNIYSYFNGGFLQISKGNTTMQNINFFNISAQERGGVIIITNYGNLTIQNATAANISSRAGSFIYSMYANKIYLAQINIFNSVSELSGSILYIDEIKYLILEGFFAGFSLTKVVGILYLKSTELEGNYLVKNLVCYGNTANSGSCIYFESANNFTAENINIDSCKNNLLSFSYDISLYVSIKGLKFINSEAPNQPLLHILFIRFYLENFECNNCTAYNHLFYFELSDLIIIRNVSLTDITLLFGKISVLFDVVSSNFTEDQLLIQSSIYGSLIKGFESNINFTNSFIKNIFYQNPESLIFIESSALECINISFTYNLCPIITAFDSDVNMNLNYVESYLNSPPASITEITKNIEISINNQFSIDNSILIENSVFNKEKGLALSILGSMNFKIINSTILQKTVSLTENQGIYLQDVFNIHIESSFFLNLSYNTASSLLIETSIELDSMNQLSILNSTFKSCVSQYYGTININGNYNVTIKDSIFENNTAKSILNEKSNLLENFGSISVLYFICKKSQQKSCFLLVTNCSFLNNYAERYISTIFSEAPLLAQNNILSNNDALLDDWEKLSSFPFDISISHENDENNVQGEIIFLSGSSFSLKLILIDNFGQRCYFDNKTVATLKASSLMKNSMIQNAVTNSQNGLLIFRNLIIKHPPSFLLLVEITLNIITFDQEKFKITKNLTFFSRTCLPGEILESDFSCKKCPFNYYNLEDPMIISSTTQKCNFCPTNFICPGGRYLIPKLGFWRFNNKTTYVLPCLMESACLGDFGLNISNILEQISNDSSILQGQCYYSHNGNLCQDCIYGYGKYDSGSLCKKCEDYSLWNYSRMVFILLVIIVYLFLNARSITDSSEKVVDLIFKMILNHTQRISLISGNAFSDFSTFVKGFFQIFNVMSFLTEDIFSNDCFMQNFTENMNNLFALKVFVSMILPVIMSFVCFGILLILSSLFFKKRKTNFLKKIFLIFLISIFIFYPLMVKCCLSLIHCIPLNNVDYIPKSLNENPEQNYFYMLSSPNIICWEGNHKKYYLVAGAFGILIWGLIFPIFIGCIIKKSLTKSKPHMSAKHKELIVYFENIQNERRDGLSVRKESQQNLNSNTKEIKLKKTIYQKDNVELFKYFFKDYKKEYYYWESVLFVQKFCLSLLPNIKEFLSDEFIQILALSIFLIYLYYMNCQPFIIQIFNKFEKFSIFICIMTIISLNVSKNFNNYYAIDSVITVFCLILNMIYFIVSIYFLYKLPNWKIELRKMKDYFMKSISGIKKR